MTEIIKRNMGVEVTVYRFHTSQLAGVLTGIITELSDRLMAIKSQIEGAERADVVSTPKEDVIELKPNFYGIGLNLNALGRRWREFISKSK